MSEPFNLAHRAPVWSALSELFVGKELQDYDYQAIAVPLSQSGYSLDELEQILRNEVAPVFGRNLSALAIPEMEGWTQESVTDEVSKYLETQRGGFRQILTSVIGGRKLPDTAGKRWAQLRSLLG
jgi:hypothetical protein